MMEWTYSYDALDEILRGDGRGGFVGISAIDGLIAAVVAGPADLAPPEWLPLIFGGRMPQALPGSPNQRVINTILRRHAEVQTILETAPDAYRPMFMNHEGRVIIYDWTVGFTMGIGTTQRAWAPLMLSDTRDVLRPILVGNEVGQSFLPELSPAKRDRIRRNAHHHIADAVIELHRRCRDEAAACQATALPRRRQTSRRRVRS